MKMTPLAKFFITIVVLAVLGYVGFSRFGDTIRGWADGKDQQAENSQTQPSISQPEDIDRSDFAALAQFPADPEGRLQIGQGDDAGQAIDGAKLERPLIVGINTWAGHAPGVVFNRGMEPSDKSEFKRQFGLDVKFILLEDPAAKLAAFKRGDIDIMWNTVDNWAREASMLATTSVQGKSILLQDWSRGGDGIVSLASIRSIEDLKGKKIACTQFTPSHFLLLYLLSQSGLSNVDRKQIEKDVIFSQDAPAAAAMFKAKQVDAAVTWEPDLSMAVTSRGDEAHVLVSTTSATKVIADTLIARQSVIDQAPASVGAFVHGWFKGIELMYSDPAGSNAIIGDALKLDEETVSGMLSGLKLTPFADNALFYGLDGKKSYYQTLFDAAFIIWRKKGLVTKVVNPKEWANSSFLEALRPQYQSQKVVEPKVATKKPSRHDRAIINKQVQIHFTPGSDTIMVGSHFVLDALGETMIAFGNTYLRVEGNTDATGSEKSNQTLSEKRASAVKGYLSQEFPELGESRFQTIGHGQSNPVAPNKTEAGRQLNRRTDIKVILAAQ